MVRRSRAGFECAKGGPRPEVLLEPFQAGEVLDTRRQGTALADPELVIDFRLSTTNTHMSFNENVHDRDTATVNPPRGHFETFP